MECSGTKGDIYVVTHRCSGTTEEQRGKDLKRQRPVRTGAEQCLLALRGPLLS